ncbi:Gfo/Idh/MocA family protein [Actinopolymorpha alba]|uniref:Gfo/Idh/MocA family protein n=1 Tax=Actinopolymorpha alba TaxID=533267 RepID=UPI00037DD0D4|nr:Gfo/Idh/MocA family oxidoreductase [Actinopolymorpha alba]
MDFDQRPIAAASPRVGLAGVNGYGRNHLRNAVRLDGEGLLRLVAYADVAPDAAGTVAALCPHPLPGYASFERLLADEALDIAVLGTPIPLHAEMIDQAFAHDVSVLVEKPPVVTVQDLDRLLQAQEGRDVVCQVGFQNARSPVIRALGQLGRSGVLGEIELVGIAGHWQRSDAYYARTDWAGALVHRGRHVLDGTLTNPFAHALMNALLVAGRDDDHPATPATVQAELYRCRDIDGDDTASVRITTDEGIPIVAAVTLVAGTHADPRVFVKGSLATATAYYTKGRLEIDPPEFPLAVSPDTSGQAPDLLANVAEVVRGTNKQLLVPLRLCRGFVLALNGMYESAGRPRPVSPRFTTDRSENGERWVHLDGVDDLIEHCAQTGQLFSEAGAGWASSTQAFSLARYHTFDLFRS